MVMDVDDDVNDMPVRSPSAVVMDVNDDVNVDVDVDTPGRKRIRSPSPESLETPPTATLSPSPASPNSMLVQLSELRERVRRQGFDWLTSQV